MSPTSSRLLRRDDMKGGHAQNKRLFTAIYLKIVDFCNAIDRIMCPCQIFRSAGKYHLYFTAKSRKQIITDEVMMYKRS